MLRQTKISRASWKLQREVCDVGSVRELDEKIEDSQIQSKHLKEELFNEQTAARLLSEENTRLKNVLSQLTIRSQLLNKKMDDLSMDKLLVDELEDTNVFLMRLTLKSFAAQRQKKRSGNCRNGLSPLALLY